MLTELICFILGLIIGVVACYFATKIIEENKNLKNQILNSKCTIEKEQEPKFEPIPEKELTKEEIFKKRMSNPFEAIVAFEKGEAVIDEQNGGLKANE